MPTLDELKLLQALPLELKIAKTKARIKEWVDFYGVDGVYISFSGGKDSTVLLHIARSMYPNIKAVFSDTGLELPSIRSFVKTHENVDWLKPKMTFGEVVKQYGYPLFSKEISQAIWYARKIKLTDNDTTPPEKTVQQANRLILQGKLTQNCELVGGNRVRASNSRPNSLCKEIVHQRYDISGKGVFRWASRWGKTFDF